jgi:hypothetical protein
MIVKKTMSFIFLLTTFLLSILFSCKKSEDAPFIKYVDPTSIPSKKMIDSFTQVQYGNMPLIISVPHGGELAPTTIPDRSCANITTATDINCIELLQAIDSVFNADYAIKPYYVFTNLKRIKLDQNRDTAEATCSNQAIKKYWNNYHFSIDTCISKILIKYPQCLFIDLHGHGHTKQRLEIGYLTTADTLRNPININANTSSLKNIVTPSLNILDLYIGSNAFGTLMASRNFPSVPSQQDNAPLVADEYFNGGFNTAKYCKYANVFGWQIETNFTGVRDNVNSRNLFAVAFTKSIMKYYTTNTAMLVTTFGK